VKRAKLAAVPKGGAAAKLKVGNNNSIIAVIALSSCFFILYNFN
jgi:hypothetical protein